MMHVLTIPSSYPHAAVPYSGVFYKEQAEAVRCNGVQVGVIAPIRRSVRTLVGNTTRAHPQHNQLPTYLYEYFAFPRLAKINDYRHIKIGISLYREYERRHGTPDLIHAHSAILAGELARKISALTGCRYIVTEHSSSFGLNLLTERELRIAQNVFARAKNLIAVSSSLCRDIEYKIPTTKGRWQCIPNSVDGSFFQKRSLGGVNKEKFSFLTISDLNKNKDVESVLYALASVDKKLRFELNIGGQGQEYERLQKLTKTLDLGDKVRFLGYLTRTEVSRALQECDAFILNSRYETFGVVLIEALAHGKPVIATACGGPQDIVRSGNGILVPVGDPASLGEAMKRMYALRNQFDPEWIRMDCLNRYGRDNIARSVISIYKQAIESRANA
jgi:glycosyltransferase involved in cell wall biosynthesis